MSKTTASTTEPVPQVTLAQALATYRYLVESSHRGPAAAVLVLQTSNGDAHVINIVVPQHHTNGSAGGAFAIRRMWAALAQLLPTPVSATFASEGWVRKMATATEETPIGEAAVVVHVEANSSWAAVQPFVRTRDGVRWEHWEQFPALGAVAEELTAIIRG